VAERARQAAMQVKGIKAVFSSIGGGSSGDAFAPGAAAEARRAVLTLTTVHRSDRKESMPDLEAEIRHKLDAIPGARFKVGPPDNGVKMQLVLRSEDPVALTAKPRKRSSAKCARSKASATSAPAPRWCALKSSCTPDFARAADLGVTAAAIGETVRVATAGDYDTDLTKMNLPSARCRSASSCRTPCAPTSTPSAA
jgi:multidrug efflux pump subunit AcrB